MWQKFFKIALILCMVPTIAIAQVIAKVRTLELNYKNTIIFETEVSEISVNVFVRALIGARDILPAKEKLYVLIVSPGGGYDAGKKLLQFLKKMQNTELICKYCASMSGQIFVASGLHRMVIEKSDILMHEMFLPHVTALNATNKSIINNLVASSEEFNKVMYTIIGISKEDYMKKITNKSWNVYGNEALKLHLADELIKIHCDDYVKMLAPQTCNPKKDDE